MNSVRILNRSIFAAVFLVTICRGLQDLGPTYKMPRSSYSGFVDGREGAIVFPRSISKRYQSGNLGDFKIHHQHLNDFPQWYKLYKNNQKLELDNERDILQKIALNNYAVRELPYFYNNLIESYDKVADEVQKYSDNDFSKRDQLPNGHQDLSVLSSEHGTEIPNSDSSKYQNKLKNELLVQTIKMMENGHRKSIKAERKVEHSIAGPRV